MVATDGIRHAIQAEAILMIFLGVVLVEFLHMILQRLIMIKPSKEELELKQKVIDLEIEAKQYNLPATFMKWAKMKRKAANLEKDMLKLVEKRRLDSNATWRKQLNRILGMRQMVLFFLLFFYYESTLPAAPLLEFSSSWMWPIGRVLALPNYSAGALSVVGWSVLCQRVSGRVFSAFV